MVVTCQIVFDQNSHGTYFAGESVSGSILLTTDKIKRIKGLVLKINGFAQTKWTENSDISVKNKHDKNSQNETIIYHGREDYIATTTYLLGSEHAGIVEIQPGLHSFTFSCYLPPQCPSSFEGKCGHIRYIAKIILLRPWKFDQTYSRGFTVLKLLDLNYDSPILRVPASQEIFKTFCCGPCSSLPLKIKVFVPQTGYVPGEDITTTLTVTNESRSPVLDLKISFVMLVTLFSQHPKMNSHLERMDLVKIKCGPINSKTTRTISQLIRVPATPPTCYNLCKIIKISYEIEVEAKVGKFHQNPFVTLPITIGNVPIVGVINHQPVSISMLDSNSNRMPATAPPRSEVCNSIDQEILTVSRNVLPGRSSIDSLQIPPPSYEEAVFMVRADINEENSNPLDKSDFVPRYPVYCCNQPSAPAESETFSNNNDRNKSTWL